MKRIIIVISLFSILMIASCKTKYQEPSIEEIKVTPSIDFIQPWAFVNYSQKQLDEHFRNLKDLGIDTVIIQNTSNYNDEKLVNCYYNTKQNCNDKSSFLDAVFISAKNTNMKIILGLSSNNYWWKYEEHHYDDNAINKFTNQDLDTLNELKTLYQPDGWYFSNEMYTNNAKYELKWVKIINSIIDNIDNQPLYMSPFISSSYKLNNQAIADVFKRLVKASNLRDIDTIMLQDGYGGLDSEYNQEKAKEINIRNELIKNTILKTKRINFYLNVELFASSSSFGSMERVTKQIAFANRIGTKIATFSMSHYYINSVDKKDQQYKEKILNKTLQ